MTKILACDLDGVLFNFNKAYTKWLNDEFRCEIPPDDHYYPTTWHYPTDDGHVTYKEEAQFWKWLDKGMNSYDFWANLPTYPDAGEFIKDAQDKFDEIVFITVRPGEGAYDGSKDALKFLGVDDPEVIITSNKGPVVEDIGATHFLEDRDKNFDDVIAHGHENLKMFLIDRPWNRHYNNDRVIRINQISEVMKNA